MVLQEVSSGVVALGVLSAAWLEFGLVEVVEGWWSLPQALSQPCKVSSGHTWIQKPDHFICGGHMALWALHANTSRDDTYFFPKR